MKINWSLMREIIRVDRITMQGGKDNNMKLILIVCGGLFGGLGFFVSPLMGLYLPFLLAGFFVPMLFQNEIKYHSTKLWALLPIRRRDLVNARFLMVYGLYAIVSTVIYLLMVLALYLQPWRLIYTGIEGSSEGVENMEIVSMLASKLGLSPIGLFNLLFFACTALGIVWIATTLRSYFRDESIISTALQLGKSGKRKKGTMEAPSTAKVENTLKADGLTVIEDTKGMKTKEVASMVENRIKDKIKEHLAGE